MRHLALQHLARRATAASSLLSDEVLRSLPDRLDGLVVEITENELVSDDPAIAAALADLRSRGGRVAVDDTGAGYAGTDPRDAPTTRRHQARSRPDHRRRHRPRQGTADQLLRALRPRHRRRRLRRGHRDPPRARVPGRPRRRLRPGLRHRTPLTALDQRRARKRPPPAWTPSRPRSPTPTRQIPAPTTISVSKASPGASPPSPPTPNSTPACSRSPTNFRPTAIRIIRPDDASQSLSDDARIGDASRLTLPIRRGHHALGELELYSRDGRPWSRFHVGRARIICNQLSLLLDSAERPARAQ